MSKMTLVIADSDKEYLEDLELYIKSYHSAAFSVKTFWNLNSFLKFLSASNDNRAVFLAGPGFYEQLKGNEPYAAFLSPNPSPGCEKQERTIFKYQTGEIIVNALYRIIPSSPQKPTKVIAVYSPLGGSGKTIVALGASILSSWEGKKVFYLNLESHSSVRAFLSGSSDQCLSHVLYYVKNSKDNLLEKLENAICIDSFYGIDYYLPPQNALDLTEDMTAEVRTLVSCLRNTGRYDCIFLDLETCLDSTNLSLLEEADVILVIAVQSPLFREKLRAMSEQLRLLETGRTGSISDKIKIILNKDKSGLNIGFDGFREIPLYHKIPFVKNLLVNREGGLWRLDMNSTFTNSVHVLLKSLQKDDLK